MENYAAAIHTLQLTEYTKAKDSMSYNNPNTKRNEIEEQ